MPIPNSINLYDGLYFCSFQLVPTLPTDDVRHTQYYYDDQGFSSENNGTALRFRTPIAKVQLCLERNLRKFIDEHLQAVIERCQSTSQTRSRRVLIPGGREDSAVTVGFITLDYTIDDVLNCPTPSGITHHVGQSYNQL